MGNCLGCQKNRNRNETMKKLDAIYMENIDRPFPDNLGSLNDSIAERQSHQGEQQRLRPKQENVKHATIGNRCEVCCTYCLQVQRRKLRPADGSNGSPSRPTRIPQPVLPISDVVRRYPRSILVRNDSIRKSREALLQYQSEIAQAEGTSTSIGNNELSDQPVNATLKRPRREVPRHYRTHSKTLYKKNLRSPPPPKPSMATIDEEEEDMM